MSTVTVPATGPVPTPASTLLAELLAIATTLSPGLTATLPGSLIEDISSTDVGALTLIDQARVDTINSLSPFAANEYILNQLGQVYGVQQGAASNTSVYVTFTGSPGYVVAQGFVVSDGTHQYTVRDGGTVGSSGQSPALYCLASSTGSWAVPVGSVTTLVTSVPSSVTLSCTNLTAGLPGADAVPAGTYRAQVLAAGLATSQGTPNYIKATLANVSGVQSNLVSIRTSGPQTEVIVGGGDPYEVAGAIYAACPDVANLTGSIMYATGITNAVNGVVTTNLVHGYSTGQVIYINGAVGMGLINGRPLAVTSVLGPYSFTINADTTGYGTYQGGGVVTPNLRNVVVYINDYPDTYAIPIVIPPAQPVSVAMLWNTTASNFVNQSAVNSLGQAALVSYINSLPVGSPLNEFEMQAVFQNAVGTILAAQLISRMVFTVIINGVQAVPTTGTGLLQGDPEGYFVASAASVSVAQG